MSCERTVAVLYADPRGPYAGVEGVDLWDKARDARDYPGPWAVVAHPPCGRWCRLAGLVESRYGHKRGDDGGCFEAALAAVRRWGGVLEHPAFSDAWTTYGLPIPPAEGWQRGVCGGWTCYVEQGRYGHPAKKATWLYAFGIEAPPRMRWGRIPDQVSVMSSAWDARSRHDRPFMPKSQRSKTPLLFRDKLLKIARLRYRSAAKDELLRIADGVD